MINALEQLVRTPMDELVRVVYDDVPVQMHPLAELSLLAHLIKLQEEGRVQSSEGRWVFIR